MKVYTYRDFLIVEWTTKGVELVNPKTERARKVKSAFAAKWRIGRSQNLAAKIGKLV
jgi:hypothetical protein